MEYLPYGNLTTGPWIAGGSIRKLYKGLDWTTGDIDVFFSSKNQYDEWSKIISNISRKDDKNEPSFLNMFSYKRKCAHLEHSTKNASTWRLQIPDVCSVNIQLIKSYFSADIIELWDTFDFTVCKFASDGNIIIASEDAIQDVENNKLRLSTDLKNRALPLRVIKYFAHGFNVDDDLLLWAFDRIRKGEVDWEQNY